MSKIITNEANRVPPKLEQNPGQGHFEFFFKQNTDSSQKIHEAALYAAHLIEQAQTKKRLGLSVSVAPIEQRITEFLKELCSGSSLENPSLSCPHPDGITLWVDQARALRHLCLPEGGKEYHSPIMDSHKVWSPNGGFSVLHNPKNDRRTTKDVNHVVDFGPPVPDDKIAVPLNVFPEMLKRALNPPEDQMIIPFTKIEGRKAVPGMTKILIHPVVVPAVTGVQDERRGEVIIVAPGGSNIASLDFASQVFGLAGDPFDINTDLSWQNEKGTGLTTCIVVAPHLLGSTKKELGLPHFDQANERQRRDGMCWKDPGELYNDGQAFKLTARDASGHVVTLISDNYFGYVKKEVKTQLSYDCNRIGGSQEEHSGGAEIARCVSLGKEYAPDAALLEKVPNLFDVAQRFKETMKLMPLGYAVDLRYPDEIIYVPKTAKFSRENGTISWGPELAADGRELSPAGEIPLRYNIRYTAPNGFTVTLNRDVIEGVESINLVGRLPETTVFDKTDTVSGGGKSELAKTIAVLLRTKSLVLENPQRALDFAAELCSPEGLKYFKHHRKDGAEDHRGILDPKRTEGSLIHLLTPSQEHHSEGYNRWLKESIPDYMLNLLCVIKRNVASDEEIRKVFFAPLDNGQPGHELRRRNPGGSSQPVRRELVRFGWHNGEPRFFDRRPGNTSDDKLSILDDISVATVIPRALLVKAGFDIPENITSVKFVFNCEERLFQRPDDASEPGADPATEKQFARDTNGFYVNYAPLEKADVKKIVNNAELFGKFHVDMQNAMQEFLNSDEKFFACTAFPRIVNGEPTKNPRFLQERPDFADPVKYYHNEVALLMHQQNKHGKLSNQPVSEIKSTSRRVHICVPAHRLADEDASIHLPNTAIWGVAHCFSPAELTAKIICTFTPKSRATTGVGDEGALTKGPFNFVSPAHDINTAVIGMLLTQVPKFVTAAGFVGPDYNLDHDATYAFPSILSRMSPKELEPKFLADNGYLEKVYRILGQDQTGSGSVLGSRITAKFVRDFGNRVYTRAETLINSEMLRPETQDPEKFHAGVAALWVAYKASAERWMRDGSYERALPGVQKVIDIMRSGPGHLGFDDPSVSALFTKEALLEKGSRYMRFLEARRNSELNYLSSVAQRQSSMLNSDLSFGQRLSLRRAQKATAARTQAVMENGYIATNLVGTLGTDPSFGLRS